MSWVAVGATVVSGVAADSAADSAASSQSRAGRDAIAAQNALTSQTRSDTALQRSIGDSAMRRLAGEFGIGVPNIARMNRLESSRSRLSARIARAEQGRGIPGEDDLREYGYDSVDEWLKSMKDRVNLIDKKIETMNARSNRGAEGTGGIYENLEMDPGYEFRLAEGEKALQRQQSAGGTRYGGAALKAAARYGQDYSSNEFSNAVNRRNAELGYLFSLAGFGQQGIASAGAAGMNTANNTSNIMMQNAAAQGQAGYTRAAGWNSAIQGGLQNWQTMQLLNNYNRQAQVPPDPGSSSAIQDRMDYNY